MDVRSDGHVRKTCADEKGKECGYPYGCMLCNLFYCGVCGGFEGSLPTHCPGYKISEDDQQLIYQATLDFRDGQWINRPYHDWEAKVRPHPQDQKRLDHLNAEQPKVEEAVARLNAS
jgi:hypothetical protein